MKKTIISLMILIGMSGTTFGLETLGGDSLSISQQINSNLYTAGGTINVSNTINGDLTSLGGDLNISGEIKEDLILMGGEINLHSQVGKDVKIAGGNVTIDSIISGDLVILGGNVRINSNSKINGDLLVFGGNIYLDGQVFGKAILNGGNLDFDGRINGNAIIDCENINIQQNGKIMGEVYYKGVAKNEKLENITNGEKHFTQVVAKTKNSRKNRGGVSGFMIYTFIGLLVFSLIFYFVFEKFMLKTGESLQTHFGKSLLFGFMFYAGIPLLAIIFFISVIGIPFGILLIIIYIFSFVFYKLINVLVVSSWIINKYLGGKESAIRKKIITIVIISIIMTPFVFFDRILSLLTYGSIIIKKSEIVKNIVQNG